MFVWTPLTWPRYDLSIALTNCKGQESVLLRLYSKVVKMKIFAIFSCLVALVCAEHTTKDFDAFKRKFNKAYETDSEVSVWFYFCIIDWIILFQILLFIILNIVTIFKLYTLSKSIDELCMKKMWITSIGTTLSFKMVCTHLPLA